MAAICCLKLWDKGISLFCELFGFVFFWSPNFDEFKKISLTE